MEISLYTLKIEFSMNQSCQKYDILVLVLIALMGLSGCSNSDNGVTQESPAGSGSSNGENTTAQAGQLQGASNQVEVHTTPFSIGIRWNLAISNDHDETYSLDYLKEDSSWGPAAPVLHVRPDTVHGADRTPIGEHYWASSLVNLKPGQSYELRATYSAYGETQSEVLQATTKAFLKPNTRRQRYVVPKGQQVGVGVGSEADPFRGLQVAADNALPGDTFSIAAGVYEAFEINISGTSAAPIAWLGPKQGEAIIDGQGTERGIITLEANDNVDGIAYHVIEGLTVRNGTWGIDAGHTHHIGVFNNNIEDVDYGFFNRRTSDLNHDQQICGNTIAGRTTYPSSDRLRKGVRIKGSNNITCFNSIRNFADCISTDEEGLDTRGSDIVGNDVSLCSDDGIEIDHDNSNMRVWQNRVSNSKSGISLQPLIGGPAYVFRNVIINVDERTIKLHNNLSGVVLVHNTGFRSGTAFSDDADSSWPNSVVKNNVFWGSFYAFSNLNMESAETRQIDFNAFGSSRDDGGNTFWIGADKYPTLAEVQAAGLLANSVPLALTDFSATAAVAVESIVNLNDFDLRLHAVASANNSGEKVSHLNAAYVFDGLSDMGVYERGEPVPLYGAEGFKSIR